MEEGFATGDGVSIYWLPDPEVSCGYTVRWCHPPESEPCVVDWETFPSNVTHAEVRSGKKIRVFYSRNAFFFVLFSWAFPHDSANGGRSHSSVVEHVCGMCPNSQSHVAEPPKVAAWDLGKLLDLRGLSEMMGKHSAYKVLCISEMIPPPPLLEPNWEFLQDSSKISVCVSLRSASSCLLNWSQVARAACPSICVLLCLGNRTSVGNILFLMGLLGLNGQWPQSFPYWTG